MPIFWRKVTKNYDYAAHNQVLHSRVDLACTVSGRWPYCNAFGRNNAMLGNAINKKAIANIVRQ